jgi:enoyl-CoA hydratase
MGDAWPDLDVTQAGPVVEVRLNRLAARNAFSRALMEQLIDVAARLRGSAAVQAVILTGSDDYFSAGADLADRPPDAPRAPTRLEQRLAARLGPDLCQAWEDLEQVTIAAIEGYCIGGAAALALACDFRIAGEGAYLRLPEIALGMNMSWRTLPRLATLCGPSRAKRFVLFCEPADADRALAWGMIDEKTERGSALALAREWAAKIAALPPIPVRMTKEAVNAAANALHRSASAMDRDQWLLTSGTADFAEGARAFFEKRKAEFKGD